MCRFQRENSNIPCRNNCVHHRIHGYRKLPLGVTIPPRIVAARFPPGWGKMAFFCGFGD